MPSVSERLANIGIPYVIAAVIVLFIARLILLRQKSPLAKSTAEVVESLMIAIALVFLVIKPFIVQSFYIPSASMVPTLQDQDHILVNKLVYRFHEPQRGDIVVFKAPPKATQGEDKDFIKRLIGLPGDVIQVRQEGVDYDGTPYGTLYLNGKRCDEPYLSEQHHIRCPAVRIDSFDLARPEIDLLKPYKVPAGGLFMMGDNRNNSDDSRFWGALDRNRVIGKASVRFWPLTRLGLLH